MGFMDELLKGAPAQAAARGEEVASQPIPLREESVAAAPKSEVVEQPKDEPAATGGVHDSDDDDDAAPPADDGSGSIPKKAYLAERAKKRDYKTQLAEERGRRLALEALVAGKQPPQKAQAAAQEPQKMPNAIEDPEGHAKALEFRLEGVRLTADENSVRDREGDDKVEAAFAVFSEAAKKIPGLYDEVMKSRSPWGQIVKRADDLKERLEVLADPVAYKARILQEERAKWEQERSGAPATQSTPQAAPTRIPPSLSQARATSGTRTADWQGPTALGDMVGRNSVAARRAG